MGIARYLVYIISKLLYKLKNIYFRMLGREAEKCYRCSPHLSSIAGEYHETMSFTIVLPNVVNATIRRNRA